MKITNFTNCTFNLSHGLPLLPRKMRSRKKANVYVGEVLVCSWDSDSNLFISPAGAEAFQFVRAKQSITVVPCEHSGCPTLGAEFYTNPHAQGELVVYNNTPSYLATDYSIFPPFSAMSDVLWNGHGTTSPFIPIIWGTNILGTVVEVRLDEEE